MFYVGQKVVCIDDSFESSSAPSKYRITLDGLSKGTTYTVREVTSKTHWCSSIGIKLVEIPRRSHGDGPYLASRFRPVVEKKTDISIFTAMLNPSKQDA